MGSTRSPLWVKPNRLPNIGTLKRVFRYDANSGKLFWRFRKEMGAVWNIDFVGWEAGYTRRDGYRIVTLNGTRFLAHRLIWKIIHGKSPKQIDHINGVRSDNRPDNLRSVTHGENRMNMSGWSGRKFPRGVSPARGCKRPRFIAQITVNGKNEYLGIFPTVEEAATAYQARATEAFGVHKRAA